MSKVPTPNRGEVWLTDFDPSIGAEIQKLRPAIVVSVAGVGQLPLRIVVPLTDWKPKYSGYPWFVALPPDGSNHLAKTSAADAVQVKSLSVERFRRRLGSISPEQLEAIAIAVSVCVGCP